MNFYGVSVTHFISRDLKPSNTVNTWDDPRAKARKGDGNLYRGVGYLQITWKINYYRFALEMQNDAANGGQAIFDNIMNGGTETIKNNYAWESAGWVWANDITGWGSPQSNFYKGVSEKLNSYKIVEKITRSINGGTAGLNDRYMYYELISTVL